MTLILWSLIWSLTKTRLFVHKNSKYVLVELIVPIGKLRISEQVNDYFFKGYYNKREKRIILDGSKRPLHVSTSLLIDPSKGISLKEW